MSVDLDIRNLRTRKDLERKEKQFFSTLRLQAKLNDDYERAMNERFRNEKLGITPTVPVSRSLEQEREDVVFQRQIADANLRTILRIDQAQKVLSQLNDDAVYALNSNFKGIEKAIEGEQNILAETFVRFLDRYLQAKASKDQGLDLTNQEMMDALTGAILRRERMMVETPPEAEEKAGERPAEERPAEEKPVEEKPAGDGGVEEKKAGNQT